MRKRRRWRWRWCGGGSYNVGDETLDEGGFGHSEGRDLDGMAWVAMVEVGMSVIKVVEA